MFKSTLPPFLSFNTEGGDGGGGGTATATPPAPNSTQTPEGEQKLGTKVTIDGKEVDVAQLLADNAKYQREAEDARVAAKAKVANDAKKAQLLNVAELAGIKIEKPEEETIESLTQKLGAKINAGDQSSEQSIQAKREAALIEAAWKANAPADKAAYLKYLASSDAELAKLDPSAADYQTNVDARVKALVDADPIFKATPGGATKSGPEGFGGAASQPEVTQEVFDKMNIQEQTKLYQTNPDLFRRLTGQA